MTTTFEVKNAKDFYEMFLLAQMREFLSEKYFNSSRHAVACAIFAYHQREWFWKDYKDKIRAYLATNKIIKKSQLNNDDYVECKFNEYVNSKCPEFRIIRDVCNGSKHLIIGTNISSSKRGGGLNGGFSGKSFNTNDLVLVMNSDTIIFKDILTKVVDYWSDLFKLLKI